MSLLPRWAIGIAAMSAPLGTAMAQSATAKQNDLVVMLHSMDQSGKFAGSLCGAAVMLSQSRGRTLLLTALHVAGELDEENENRRLNGEPPLRLAAQFFGAVGSYYEVRPLPGIFSRSLDYAVLEVVPQLGTTVGPPRSWKRLGTVVDPGSIGTKPRFQDVRAIGNSACRPWTASVSPEKVMSFGGIDIVFESHFVQRGSSGGGLFAADGGLVGMVVNAEGDQGTARSIDVILSDLAVKNIDSDLASQDTTEAEPDDAGKAATYASQVKATSIPVRIEKTGGTYVTYRAMFDGLKFPVADAKLLGGPAEQEAEYGFDLKISDAFSGAYTMQVEFSDASKKTLPIDLKTPLTTRIKALAESDTRWLDYNRSGPGSISVASPNFEVVGLIKAIDLGWSPTDLPHHAVVQYSGFGQGNLSGVAALNAVDQGQEVVRPANVDRAWYRITFADGSVTPPRERVIDREQLDPARWDYRAAYLLKTPEGVIFPYTFSRDFSQGVPAGGVLSLYRPYGLKGSYRLQYDLDGKGFLDADRDVPWPTTPFKVRYMTVATGAVSEVFRLPAPDIAAVRDFTPPIFPKIECRRAQAIGTCEFSDFRVVGHIKSWRMSFVSEAQLRPMPLGDLVPAWRSVEGRDRLLICMNDRSGQCEKWRRDLGALWDIPTGATDFYYSVMMNDGRILGPQRIALPR